MKTHKKTSKNRIQDIFKKYNLYLVILNLASLFLFFKMLEDISNGELITQIDSSVNASIMHLWNPALNSVMIFITNIASPTSLSALAVLLLIFLMYKHKKYLIKLLVASMLSGLVTELLVKFLVHRVRPEDNLISFGYSLFNYHYSFPSGHATMATIFFSLLLYSFKDNIKNTVLKDGFILSCILAFLLVGFSRIYLNVHWVSDVIAGIALGIFWVTFYILLFALIEHRRKKQAS